MTDPPVALFWGGNGFLLRLAAHDLLSARDLRATEVDARDWQGGETSDLATPSLWGERRALLVKGCQNLPEVGAREVLSYLEAPSPEALCVLTVVTQGRTLPPLAKAVGAAGGLVRQIALRPQDLPKWLIDRARQRGVKLTGPGATVLVGTLGEDPAALDQAIRQLGSAFAGRPIGPEEVRAQFVGVGEQRVWDLCDHALSGRLPPALVVLRSLLEAREDPLLVLGGITSRLRDLIKVRSLPEGLSSTQAARAAGLRFDWQLRRYRDQATRFSPEELVTLHRQATEADQALKGGAAGDVILPALVASMAGEPGAAIDVPIRVSR